MILVFRILRTLEPLSLEFVFGVSTISLSNCILLGSILESNTFMSLGKWFCGPIGTRMENLLSVCPHASCRGEISAGGILGVRRELIILIRNITKE